MTNTTDKAIPNSSESSSKEVLDQSMEIFHVVGVGASAGGLEALGQFFENMPEDSGLCFIVVQHLSPDFKSMMDELLARRTRIPIVPVEDGTEIRPNCIFLMPPRKEMILAGGRLLLTDKDPSQGFALPIDRFLRSLAQDAGVRSVGVILSGTGSDGSRGIRDIHDAGGLVVAQSEESAKFDGMPRSARETGLVDLVLPAADMADAILKLVRRSREIGGHESEPTVPEVGLQAIFRMLRSEYGIDFSQYKLSTVIRRIERRLLLNQSMDVEQYVQRLAESGAELNQLYKDLLIGVTHFFRDCEAFHRLSMEELPRLLSNVDDEQEFRVWVAGCATGEEAYSLAMLIQEQLELLGRQPTVRVFATDAHRSSLDIASAGLYAEEAMAGVSPQRRERFFTRKGNSYQVVPTLRKMIVFAPHDVLKDAPFTRIDLISCRNMLIYLQPAAQKKVLSLFHFGLKTGGTLFLGPSESPGDLSDEFDRVDEHWRLFRKQRDMRLRPDFRLMMPPSAPVKPRVSSLFLAGSAAADRLQQQVYDRLLEEHMPPSFLMNDRKELVHCFGGAGKYLRVRDGRSSNQLLDLVDNELKMILLGALARAEKQLTPVAFTGIRVPTEEGDDQMVRLTVKPINDRVSGLTSYLILLEDIGPPVSPRDETTIDLGAASREQVQTLEQELRYTRENLQAMIEEQESSNEELQATNEELVASNEQLQSTNEELHSVNEELYTVNAEYQHKIDELTRVTADLENLFLATDVGILFLDRHLSIRRFTPRISALFKLLPRDIDRPIRNFTPSIVEPVFDWLEEVLSSGKSIERETFDKDGHCYFLRILPYRLGPDVADGVVLSLIDISALKQAEARLQHLSAIVESSGEAIIGKRLDGVIVSWNRGAEEIYGYRAVEMIGRDAQILYPEDSTERFSDVAQKIRLGQSVTQELRRQRKDGTIIDVLHTVSPIYDQAGRLTGASTISRDITLRKEAERRIQTSIRNRDRFLAMLSHELRNPLGAILNAANLLERARPLDHRVAAASLIVARQANQMSLLLDDLLDVSRITQNKIVLRKQRCVLAAVVAEAAAIIQPLATSRQQRLETAGLDNPHFVEGDPARLQQVFINLFKNASKYSPNGGRIAVSLTAEDEHTVVRVHDNGMGIAPEMIDQVFEMFVQSQDTLERADGGLGVGLTLAKSIVELHGGTLTAFSAGPGHGSEFTVRLPLMKNQTPDTTTGESPPRVSPVRQSLRIAIIEDKADSRATLQSLLQLDGHEVRTAGDGIQGLQMLFDWQPDVALIDIGLPGLDGFEVARRLCQHTPRPATSLVALTGYGLPSDREKVLEAGFQHHLVKPLKIPELNGLLEGIRPIQPTPTTRPFI